MPSAQAPWSSNTGRQPAAWPIGSRIVAGWRQVRVGEALELFASFYRDPADPDRPPEELGPAGRRGTAFAKLSGGQRLSIALALVGNPEVAILDELSTGLDPHARRDTWRLIERIRDRGVTVVLVSHYMEEIGRLGDRATHPELTP